MKKYSNRKLPNIQCLKSTTGSTEPWFSINFQSFKPMTTLESLRSQQRSFSFCFSCRFVLLAQLTTSGYSAGSCSEGCTATNPVVSVCEQGDFPIPCRFQLVGHGTAKSYNTYQDHPAVSVCCSVTVLETTNFLEGIAGRMCCVTLILQLATHTHHLMHDA